MTTYTFPTETVTRYVQKDSAGRVVAVLNELAATQLGGVEESWTVPAHDDTRHLLMGARGVASATRHADGLTWTVTPLGGYHAHSLIRSIGEVSGWRASLAPSGSRVFVWPPATPRSLHPQHLRSQTWPRSPSAQRQ